MPPAERQEFCGREEGAEREGDPRTPAGTERPLQRGAPTHTGEQKQKTINLTNYVHKSFKNLVWTGPITILMFQLFKIYIINYMITMGGLCMKESMCIVTC